MIKTRHGQWKAARMLMMAVHRISYAARHDGPRAKHGQIVVAAEVAHAVLSKRSVARQFERLASEKGIAPTRAHARRHIRLLKYLGVKAPGGSLPRHSDQIDALLHAGHSPTDFASVVRRNGLCETRRRRIGRR